MMCRIRARTLTAALPSFIAQHTHAQAHTRICARGLASPTSPSMASIDAALGSAAVNASASRLERHMQSKFAAEHSYSKDCIQYATLPVSAITLAYVVHESEAVAVASGGGEQTENETRVVLLMGYSYRKEEWAPTVDALITQWEQTAHTSKLQILSFDNRGVGDSDAPWGRYSTAMMAEDTLALMDHVGWRAAHIIGTSMGGMISQELALMAPERVQSLSLVVTSRGKFCPAYSALGAIVSSSTSTDKMRLTAGVLEILYPKAFLDSTLGGSTKTMRSVVYAYHRDGSAARGAPTTAGKLGQSAALVLHYVSDERLRQIRDHGYPILIIGARHDVAIDASHALHLQRVLTGDHVRSVMYEDAGHGVFLQCIDEVARDLLEVIQRSTEL